MIRIINNGLLKPYEGYKININGKTFIPSSVRVSKIPFNTPWPGKQRNINQTEESGYIHIVSNEEIVMSVTTDIPYDNYIVRPISKNVESYYNEGSITLRFKEKGTYVLELDNEHKSIHICIEEERDFNEYGKPTYEFKEGIQEVGKLILKDGDRIFVDENTILKGNLISYGAKDVKIYGYGIIDGSIEKRTSPECYNDDTIGCVRIYDSNSFCIDGVSLIDSANWVLCMFGSSDIHINDVKILGQWRYNTDGIDIVNSKDVTISNSFIHTFDDSISIKGILPYKERSNQNILVENSTIWCGWGRSLEIGLETLSPLYENIVFRNCDLIHNSAVALDVQSGDYAEIRNILFDNIRVEYSLDTLPEIMENPLGSIYDNKGRKNIPNLIKISTYEYYLGPGFEKYDCDLKCAREGKHTSFKDITFNNIKVLLEGDCDKPEIVYSVREDAYFEEPKIEKITYRRYSKKKK